MDVLESRALPEVIENVAELEDLLSTPTAELVKDFACLEGDLLILGASGKVGPTLSRMAKRAAPKKRVIGVARFSDLKIKQQLEEYGIETMTTDLLDRSAVQALPHVENIVYMAGKKFGTAGSEPDTWAMNAVVPVHVGEMLHKTRFVAFSTLCVYPFSEVKGPGSAPATHPSEPLGEYPNSCVARERIFQYYSKQSDSPGRLARLNYAIDLRYGVLQDVASKVLNKKPIDIRTGVANVIWQGDATAQILRCLHHGTVPATAINIGAEKPAEIRYVAQRFGEIFGIEPIFKGEEADRAWHNDTAEAKGLFGSIAVDLDTMIRWNAHWLQKGGALYNKPTHYDQRDGKF